MRRTERQKVEAKGETERRVKRETERQKERKEELQQRREAEEEKESTYIRDSRKEIF